MGSILVSTCFETFLHIDDEVIDKLTDRHNLTTSRLVILVVSLFREDGGRQIIQILKALGVIETDCL